MGAQITPNLLRGAVTEDFPVIDLGDYLRGASNDRFLSTAHLAVNLTDRDRYSTPFFYSPYVDYPITCLPTCCNSANPPKYPPITYGEYQRWCLNNNYRTKLVEA
jgi:isopenicillin N synthase-like dioxygenase